MSRDRLSPGRSGNVSVRCDGGYVITPTGMAYEQLSVADLVLMDSASKFPRGSRAPSSEWHFHGAIYSSFPEASAVVHAHSSAATSLACLRREIPPFHYMVAVAGGSNIRVAEYATFGTHELAQNIVHALEGRRACLLANHGQVAFGKNAEAALELAWEVENLADQYLRALGIGEPILIDDGEMERVLLKFETYGQSSPHRG